MLYNDSKNKYDFNKLNEQVITLLAKEGYNITDPRKNIQCINAGNHNHGDKNHSCTIYSDGLYCHGCNKLYGFTDIVAKKYGYNINNNDYLKEKSFYRYLDKEIKALNLLDSVSVARTSSHDIDMTKLENSNAKEAKKIPQKYVERYKSFTQMKLDNFSYFNSRGISQDTCKEINACIANMEQIRDIFLNDSNILPTLNINDKMFAIVPIKNLDSEIVGMTFRNIDKEDYFKHLLLKGISKEPFYTPNITKETQNEVIFICEGIYDALSLYELGFKAVATLGEDSLTGEELPSKNCYIVLPDNDIAGIRKAGKTQIKLEEAGHTYISYEIAKEVYNNSIFKKCKDANDMLLKDSELLKEKITELYELGYNLVASLASEQINMHAEDQNGANKEVKRVMNQITLEDNKNALKAKYESESNAERYIRIYKEYLSNQCDKKISTGIDTLDTCTDGGFKAGDIVLLGGKAGIGKTAMAIQISLELVSKGEKVIFYSCEMSMHDMLERYISLYKSINKLESKTNIEILELMQEKNILDNISIYTIVECATLEELLKIAEEKKANVFIDYLHITPTLKRGTDSERIKEITRLTRDYTNRLNKLCVIIVAFNRGTVQLDKNGEEISQTPNINSGRDTSDIEYSADLYIALYLKYNCKCADYATYSEALSSNPRLLRMITLKNRHGQAGLESTVYHITDKNYFTSEEF